MKQYNTVFNIAVLSALIIGMTSGLPVPFEPNEFASVNDVEFECEDVDMYKDTCSATNSGIMLHCDAKCDYPMMILESIDQETVANYTTNHYLFIRQLARFADFVERKGDMNEQPVPFVIFINIMNHISFHLSQMRDIVNNLSDELEEIENWPECAGLLDIWAGYRVFNLAI